MLQQRERSSPSAGGLDQTSRRLACPSPLPATSQQQPFIVAATLVRGPTGRIHDIGLNPRRTGLLDIWRVGARVIIFDRGR